ncbi:uncharacterized protein LOC106638957 [Copidosoma floridanum]|uniref:uncharacterized protein LOC106638957 n=1 Tax=Copidosoma floridanum TaxID=29053 RepID=UPI0006C9D77B|nr:uncharacterized protein LOC106638957 [Copidosoma floridanum]XP_014207849.1 uncharacterized protein LOC106638957 [Copidosoma floridanum]XP_014207850.1 uncharacterized protein LOC106638957 [Copidosoma floridanum]
MEGDQKSYDLRRRSRSRSETPLILNKTEGENDGSEHHYDLRSKSRDRSMTPGIEVSSSRRSTSRSLPSSVVKARNKDMEVIVEQKDITLTDVAATTPSKNTTFETSTVKKKAERRSERQRIKKQIFANGQSESVDDSSDANTEIKDRKSFISKRLITSDYSSEDCDREDIPSRPTSVHEFYKQQGDYWNKFPKTDYTYSKASTCRYEVAPGVMAIPNMSRRSLRLDSSIFSGQTTSSQSSLDSYTNEHPIKEPYQVSRGPLGLSSQMQSHVRKYTSTNQSNDYKKTLVDSQRNRPSSVFNSQIEDDLNERYESWVDNLKHLSSNYNYKNTLYNVDSDTDCDELDKSSSYTLRKKQKSNTTSLFLAWFTAVLHFITFGQFQKQEYPTSHYHPPNQETRLSWFWQQFDAAVQHIYLLFVKIILFDSWLLSRASKLRDRAQGRWTKILWLLLPLVLTIGYLCLPLIVPAISWTYQKTLPIQIQRETDMMQSYSPEDIKINQELKNLVNILINRVQYLEIAESERSVHLSNITQSIEDLKHSGGDVRNKYDSKLSSLEQELALLSSESKNFHADELGMLKVEFQNLKQLYGQLKTCCDATSSMANEDQMREQADKVFAGYFGDAISKDDIVKVFQIMNSKIQHEEIAQASGIVGAPSEEPEKSSTSLSIDEIRKIVVGILKIYDADKTGRVDYALESAGGQVCSTRCTQKYNVQTRAFRIWGVTLFYENNNPRTVIQGKLLQPGMCWAFQDFPGYLLIRLRSRIYLTGFTMEHASRANLPNGEMKSAPRKFNVWGLRYENDLDPVMFGEYEFLVSDDSLQYFPVQNTTITEAYEYVELRIHSNHGQLEYTCLYRFRIHGNPA